MNNNCKFCEGAGWILRDAHKEIPYPEDCPKCRPKTSAKGHNVNSSRNDKRRKGAASREREMKTEEPWYVNVINAQDDRIASLISQMANACPDELEAKIEARDAMIEDLIFACKFGTAARQREVIKNAERLIAKKVTLN